MPPLGIMLFPTPPSTALPFRSGTLTPALRGGVCGGGGGGCEGGAALALQCSEFEQRRPNWLNGLTEQ